MFNREVWLSGEAQAQKYLRKQGYKIIGTNLKVAGVEVDIVSICPRRIMIKNLKTQYKSGKLTKQSYVAGKKLATDTLVFVEVKSRSSDKFGLPQEAVNQSKQNRIRRFAQAFVKNDKYKDMPVRFDIISCLGGELEHISDAF